MGFDFVTPDDLYESSQKYAMSALGTYGTVDHQRFPSYAATSLEHLAKACLLAKNPALLIELKESAVNEASLLALIGLKPQDLSQIRTIGITGALSRLRNLSVISGNRDELSKLVELRNGHIHFGRGVQESDELLQAYINQVELILTDLSKDVHLYWGTMLAMVNSFKERNSQKIARTVARKFAQSKIIFESKISGLDSETVRQIINRPVSLSDGEEVMSCPVCNSNGIACGENQMVFDGDDDGPISMWVEFWAEKFRCPNCMLILNSDLEMEEAELETVIVLEEDPDLNFEYHIDETD